jgi:hypothetical protein
MVEYERAVPSAVNFNTKASKLPLELVSNAPDVMGKSEEIAIPVT